MRYVTSVEQLPQGAAISIYGAGGAGRELLRQVRASGRVRAVRFLDSGNSGELDGLPVVRFADYLNEHPGGDGPVVIASTHDDDIAWALKNAGITDFCSFKDSHRYILCNLICDLLPASERFTLLDVGARDAAGDQRWLGIPPERMRLYGFELDEGMCAQMTTELSRGGMECRFFPYGLWGRKEQRTFHFSEGHPGSSSLYPFDFEVFDRWKIASPHETRNEGQFIRPVREVQVQVDTLDNWRAENAVASVDFMKLNVQGAELEILRGGARMLPEVMGLLLEMSFVENYRGRPLFSDVDPFLRSQGLSFFEMIGPLNVGRNDSPVTTRQLPGYHHWHGQLVESHCLYFRDPIAQEKRGKDLAVFTKERVLKLAALAERYFQVEYAFEVLVWAERRFRAGGEASFADGLREIIDTAAQRYRKTFGG